MTEKIKNLYESQCCFDKQCNPIYVFRSFESGITHYKTQCQKCGDSFGQPISRKIIDPSITISPFDQEFYDKCMDEIHKPYAEFREMQKKLLEIRKIIRKEYYKRELNIDHIDFDSTYAQYLSSPAWEKKRLQILNRDNFICRFCSSSKATQVHHLSYQNLGSESELELISVCYRCHQHIHNIEASDRSEDKFKEKDI